MLNYYIQNSIFETTKILATEFSYGSYEKKLLDSSYSQNKEPNIQYANFLLEELPKVLASNHEIMPEVTSVLIAVLEESIDVRTDYKKEKIGDTLYHKVKNDMEKEKDEERKFDLTNPWLIAEKLKEALLKK